MKKKEICKLYYDYVIEHKKAPKKLKKFLLYASLTKEEFLLRFEDLHNLEQEVWRRAVKDVIKSLKASAEFSRYTTRDRGVSFMFTWFECLSDNRDFFASSLCSASKRDSVTCPLKGLKKEVKSFMKELIECGVKGGEFQNRGMQSKLMTQYFWSLFQLNLKAWQQLNKKSCAKQELWMDAMIEKSMLLFFDSLAPNLFDTFLDMLKHQRAKK